MGQRRGTGYLPQKPKNERAQREGMNTNFHGLTLQDQSARNASWGIEADVHKGIPRSTQDSTENSLTQQLNSAHLPLALVLNVTEMCCP